MEHTVCCRTAKNAPSAAPPTQSVAEAARRDAFGRPAGGRRPTRSTSRIYFVTAFYLPVTIRQ